MLTNETALCIAKQQLDRALYDMNTCANKGLYTIAQNKADWLSRIIQMAESYCNFHWVDCSLIMPESLLENVDKQVIPCIVAVRSKYPNGKPNIEKRMRQRKRNGDWEWSKGKKERITHWASLPSVPKVP
jgi:hypothetical protein